MSRLRRTRRRFRRVMTLAVADFTAAAVVGACSSGGTQAGSGGSATSGTVNWWGWSPSAQAAAADIAAFNKVYPHIKVNYKLLPVTGVAEAMRPGLAAGALGPGRATREATTSASQTTASPSTSSRESGTPP
jgi:raffinose/stachyose/melibiose transport system substrate-binding protein